MLRTLLNGTETTNPPKGLDEINEEFFFDSQSHGYLYQVSGSLTFQGPEYDLLRALYDSQYCQDVEIDIQYSDTGSVWNSKVKGLIKLAGCKWDLIKQEVESQVVDNSYLSRINNNKNIEFTLGVYHGPVLSKNGVDVSAKAIYHSDIQLFSPFRGRTFAGEALYNKTNPPFPAGEGDDQVDMRPAGRTGIFIYDALNLLIAMLTDDEVEFESTFFSYNLGSIMDAREEAFSAFFSGQHLRHGSGYPTINFSDLTSDLHKLCDVFFSLEVNSAGRPVLRVEDEDYFRQTDSQTYFDSIDSLLESINLSKIYSHVRVGCSRSSGSDFPIGEIPMVNHVQEEFALEGTCNVDNTLDLQLQKIIVSTNNIAAALPSISGFSNGGSVIRKFTTGDTTAGPNQQLTDTAADFQIKNVEVGFLIHNTVENTWSYITGVPDNDNILIEDQIFTVDATGLAKDYEIFKPTEDSGLFEDVFLIQLDRETYDASSTFLAYATVITPPADLYYYNDTFSNYNVLQRHMGNSYGQALATGLSDGNDEFNAEVTSDQVFNNTTYFPQTSQANYRRVRFDDDFTGPTFFDTNGNYDAVTGIYTAPQGGYYHAHAEIEFTSGSSPNDFRQQIGIVRVSAGGSAIENESEVTTILNGTVSFIFVLDDVFYLQAGERLEVWVKKPFDPDLTGPYPNSYVPWSEFDVGGYGDGYGIRGIGNTTFTVDALFNGGGPEVAVIPSRVLNIESELSVERSVFDSVLTNPFTFYHLNKGNNTYVTGFIDKIERGIENGEATITLFRKKNSV